MAQLSYQIDMTVGIEGALADPDMDKYTVSRVALASLPCGKLVVADATASLNGKGVKLPDADFTGSGDVEGVLMWDPARAPQANGNNFAAGDALPVLRKGRIYVKPEDAVARNAQAFARFSAGTGSQLGAFRSDDDTATAAPVPSARYLSATTAADEITVLEINLPTTAAQ